MSCVLDGQREVEALTSATAAHQLPLCQEPDEFPYIQTTRKQAARLADAFRKRSSRWLDDPGLRDDAPYAAWCARVAERLDRDGRLYCWANIAILSRPNDAEPFGQWLATELWILADEMQSHRTKWSADLRLIVGRLYQASALIGEPIALAI
ncbi:MAG TPA: hypothetical protein VHU61_08505 [Solirubrobacteraceae bacterium]|jgi:hypothetical protein|nr:hypothetical protein [Solirubrobacteraceae bacterium]